MSHTSENDTSLNDAIHSDAIHPAPRAAAVEVGVVLAAITFAWLATRFLLYPALGVPDNAPMILRPILGFLAAWLLLRNARRAWRDLGLCIPPNALRAVGVTLALVVVTWSYSRFALPVIAGWFDFQPEPPFLAYIRGSLVALIGWMAISWIVGGFMEELLFRGFLLQRLEAMFGGRTLGIVIGLVGQAALFGALHLYQGSFGFVFAFSAALINGVAFLAAGRNLWPVILVHGAWNSMGMLSLYGSG